MRRTLKGAFQNFIFVDGRDAGPGNTYKRFADDRSVLHFLHALSEDHFNMALLRSLYLDDRAHLGAHRCTDAEIVEGVHRFISMGRLKVIEDVVVPTVGRMRGASEGSSEEPQEEPPADPFKPTPVAAPVKEEEPVVNVVTPIIEMEYKVVLLDRDHAKIQKDAGEKDEDLVYADATYITVCADQTKKANPYQQAGKLKFSPANVDVYLDEQCKTKADGDPGAGIAVTNEQLTGGGKLKLYLRGKTAGKFEASLELEAPAGPDIELDQNPATEEMGVVELKLLPHQQDTTEIEKIEIDPDLDPPPLAAPDDYDKKPEEYHPNLMKQYHESLRDEALPDQKAMTDKEKVETGRLLHVQKDGHFGRARLLLEKLDGGQWPADTDDYFIVINEACVDGSLELYDAETEGSAKSFPIKLKVSDLKAAEQLFWVQGKSETSKLRNVRLNVGMDRAAGGPARKVKRNGDWARFTVVKINEVKVDYTEVADRAVAWDEDKEKFHINLGATWDDSDPNDKKFTTDANTDLNGRKIVIGAQLSQKIENVTVHFMLAPDKNNFTAANWGEDLPKGGTSPAKKQTSWSIVNVDDHAKFSIGGANNDRLFFDDGVLDHSVKNEYKVTYEITYDDGSKENVPWSFKVKENNLHNWNTTGGKRVKKLGFDPADIPLWKWNKITADIKHKDRDDRKNLLHWSAQTDADGYARKELILSRVGGDIFHPACYLDQDPHLANYVEGHADLEKRKPVLANKQVQVWRKIWYQFTKASGFDPPQPAAAVSAYEDVRAEMLLAQEKSFIVMAPAGPGEFLAPDRTFYKEYILKGGNSDTLVANLGDYNKEAVAEAAYEAKSDQPVKNQLIVCSYQYDDTDVHSNPGSATGLSAPIESDRKGEKIVIGMGDGKYGIIDPPLDDAKASMIEKLYWYRKSDVVTVGGVDTVPNAKRHDIPVANAGIPKPRADNKEIEVTIPDMGAPPPTVVDPVYIKAKCKIAFGSYLGESFGRNCLIVYDPNDVPDYNDTVTHELGHALNQTPKTGKQPTDVPDHPEMADEGQGNHCRIVNATGNYKCVMYDAGPNEYGIRKYCEVCHPYLLVENFWKFG